MNKRQVFTRTAGIILMAGAMLGASDRLHANDESVDRAAKEQARRIEGVWLPIVTITDCQTQAVITTFPSMEIYVRGGGYIGFGAVQKSDQVGMGAWRHAGGRNYISQYQFFGYVPSPGGAPDGAPDGTLLKVSATIPPQCRRHRVYRFADGGRSRFRWQRPGASLRDAKRDAAGVGEVWPAT